MNLHRIADSVRHVLRTPPAPGLTSLDCVGGVYCAVRHQLRAISLPVPAAVFILEGRKILWRGDERLEVPAGGMFLLPARMELNIENEPDASSGTYLALCLSFPPETVESVCSAHDNTVLPATLDDLRVSIDPPLLQTIDHLLNMITASAAGDRVLRLCLEEILELAGQRTDCLPLLRETINSWAGRCARIVATDPARDWSAAELAARLYISERGLRRYLKAEGTGLRRILQDIRLNTGLGLLQSGRYSVGEAAARCGYNSASRFAALFRDRFGVSPADIGRFNAAC